MQYEYITLSTAVNAIKSNNSNFDKIFKKITMEIRNTRIFWYRIIPNYNFKKYKEQFLNNCPFINEVRFLKKAIKLCQDIFSELLKIRLDKNNITITTAEIYQVYEMLNSRIIHPSGSFDNKKRFYALNSSLINVRSPSAKFPFSELLACRTLQYCKKVAEHFKCKNKRELLKKV